MTATLTILPVDSAHAVDLDSVQVVFGLRVKVGETSEICDCCQLVWNVADVLGFVPTRHNLCPLCTVATLDAMARSAHAW